MATIDIPANERGKVRVFSISLPDAEGEALSNGTSRVAETLGTDTVDAKAVEVFRTSDLEGVGLPAYLVDGNGAVASQVEKDRARLAALEGWVMVVASSAFHGVARTLSPVPALTLIGTYDEERPDMSVTPMESESAQPYTGTPQTTPATPPRGRAGGALVVAALAVLVILLLWWALT